ncbi:MAG: pyridoxine 4-dehydrogenase [Solirubrobacteraceae bacterium]|nr:pyridoxine 4-dehydrogenase [Solirubrobacteraceae bacterium]
MTGSPTNPQRARLGPHTVNRVGFGAMQLAGPGVFGPPADPAAARAVLRRAIELGVDHIDTAQYYGPEVVNELIRDALRPYPVGLRIVSKVGARRDGTGGVLPASHPDELRAGVEANLQTLQVDALALVNLRLMGHDARGRIPLAEQLGALTTLQAEGKIESIGLSNASVDEVASALETVDLGEVQNAYNIGRRDDEDVLRLCAERDIAYVPFFPIGSPDDPAISTVAAKHGATRAQIALAWLLHKDEHVLLIPGTSSAAHLEQNVAAARIALDDDDLAALDGVSPVSVMRSAGGR